MKLKYKFVVQETGSDYVAVAVGSDAQKFNGMLRFREEGFILFQLLQKGTNENEMLTALKQDFTGNEQEMQQEVKDFINQLNSAGLLVE